MEILFVYGTLKDPEVRLRLTGKKFYFKKNRLTGFILNSIKQNKDNYPIVEITNDNRDIIEGEMITVSSKELKIFDKYEGDDYRRIEVLLENGIKSWVYCK